MNKFAYIVMHNMGIDGTYVIAVFSNYKDAQKLVELFNQSSEADDYNFCSVSKIQVNKYNIADFKLVTEDNWTSLFYKDEEF